MMLSAKVAVNPLPWVLSPDGFDLSPATVAAAVAGIAQAGFTAIHADVPAGMDAAGYRTLRSDHGIRPAPGYFGAHFDGPATELPGLLDAARRHTACRQNSACPRIPGQPPEPGPDQRTGGRGQL